VAAISVVIPMSAEATVPDSLVSRSSVTDPGLSSIWFVSTKLIRWSTEPAATGLSTAPVVTGAG
jgi:hypothetical protein